MLFPLGCFVLIFKKTQLVFYFLCCCCCDCCFVFFFLCCCCCVCCCSLYVCSTIAELLLTDEPKRSFVFVWQAVYLEEDGNSHVSIKWSEARETDRLLFFLTFLYFGPNSLSVSQSVNPLFVSVSWLKDIIYICILL